MAARRRTATVSRPGGGIVLVQPPAAPIARRSSGGGRRRRRRSRGRRRSSGDGGSLQKTLTGVAIGGLAYGLLVKNWPQLPRLPGIGRSGTVAIAVALLKPSNPILRNVGVAAAAIAGYSFGESVWVCGDDGVLAYLFCGGGRELAPAVSRLQQVWRLKMAAIERKAHAPFRSRWTGRGRIRAR